MSYLQLHAVHKRFGTVQAVSGLSLTLDRGQLLVLAGPSGSGKTTTLRLIAGLERLDSGTMTLDGVRLDTQRPCDRHLAMVFQQATLYPHMSVARNIAFALRTQRLDTTRQRDRIEHAADLLDITDLLDRKPHQLSGGQRKRAALAKAIAVQPRLLLLDEPLASLDPALKHTTRIQLTTMLRELGITAIIVTHDPSQAMAMGDRIAIMHNGQLAQLDSPERVYAQPADRCVASSLGLFPMNFIPGTLDAGSSKLCFCAPDNAWRLPFPAAHAQRLDRWRGRKVVLGIRPEHLEPQAVNAPIPSGRVGIPCTCRMVESLGSMLLVTCQSAGPEPISCQLDAHQSNRYGALCKHGQRLTLILDPASIHLFSADERGINLMRVVEDDTDTTVMCARS